MNINKAIQSALEHHRAGNLQQAELIYRNILKKRPNDIDALHLLGVLRHQLGDYDSAIKYIRKAIELDADFAEAYNNLGNAIREKGFIDEAEIYYQKALQIDPTFAIAYNNLGNIYTEKKLCDRAMLLLKKAIQIDPNLAEAYNNLGKVFAEKGNYDEAIACYQKTLQLNPNFADAYYNLGNAYWEAGRSKEARGAFDMDLSINPDSMKARLAKCISLIPIIFPDNESIEISRNNYEHELLKLGDEISLKTRHDITNAAEAIGSQQPYYLAYQGLNDLALQQVYGSLVHKIMTARFPQFSRLPVMPTWSKVEPIRVGVISGLFYNHTVWKLFRGWFENLDRKEFTLFGYYTGKLKDNITERAKQHFSHFSEDIDSFEDLCHIIQNDNLHAIIYPEIGMDPIAARLAALRFAPVQCVAWGHPETTGLPTIDYFLSSELMEPLDADDHYTEKLVRLPNISIYYNPIEVAITETNRDMFGLPHQSVLYLCCQSLYKYLPQYDDIYPRIAQQLDDCQFLFISNPSDFVTEQFRLRIKNVFKRYKMNADNYVIFLPRLDARKYYAINCLSDIYLDSIGWSGGNTTLEAIACNLPVVTIPGKLMRGRHSTAILTMMGLTETIADLLDNYIEIAVRLGKDLERRKHISKKIADNKHNIYQDMKCVTALEEFLERAIKEKMG